MTSDGRVARGDRTRTAVLDTAVSLATEVGLHGLSLGQLADRLEVSKSGLFAHWRSKEALQLATVDRAVAQWQERILGPPWRPPGAYAGCGRCTRPGSTSTPPGCCPAAASSPTPSSSTTLVPARSGTGSPRRSAAGPRSSNASSRRPSTSANSPPTWTSPQLAYEIDALGISAVMRSRLLDPDATYRHARQGLLNRLRALCPDPTLLPEGQS